MLGPVSSHAAAETRQEVASLESQPTVAGHSGDHPPDLETLRATPARPHQIVIQGNLARAHSAFLREGAWGLWTLLRIAQFDESANVRSADRVPYGRAMRRRLTVVVAMSTAGWVGVGILALII